MDTQFKRFTCLFYLAGLLCSPLYAAPANKTLDIYWVDVEGGGATLVVTPGGASVLVDTGMPGDRDPRRIHQVATKEAGLKQIDHLVTTHFDIDHYGGAADLARLIPIVTVWDTGIPLKDPNGKNDERFLASVKPYRDMKVEQRRLIAPGDLIPLPAATDPASAKLALRCLAAKQMHIKEPVIGKAAPNPLCTEDSPKVREMNDNANSVVLLLEFGSFRFFDGADLLWDLEKDLVCPVNLVGQVDVYQVTHHGLDVSNNPLIVRSLAPTVAVMVNGVTKGCGAETCATLKGTRSIQAVYQLHKNLRPDSEHNTTNEHIANLDRNCAANFIKLSVAPDGKSYTISIPARNHQRTFQTKNQ